MMLSFPSFAQKKLIEPTYTYLFCQRDSCDLYLDIYEPSASIAKPQTIIYLFGGGFMQGHRDDAYQLGWFKQMVDAGYRIVSIDYRLGLKGFSFKGLISFANVLFEAIQIAVDDLFAATVFLVDNADNLHIDPASIVIAGSSAGAITALQAEWEICNGHESVSILPEGFNYAGVMSFSGMVLSNKGEIRYAKAPCPHFMCHGGKDAIVPFGKMSLMQWQYKGSFSLASDFKRNGFNYQIWRFDGHSHEISISMSHMLHEELSFLENNVGHGTVRLVDATIKDYSMDVPDWGKADFKMLY